MTWLRQTLAAFDNDGAGESQCCFIDLEKMAVYQVQGFRCAASRRFYAG
jgi:hypothetical protein